MILSESHVIVSKTTYFFQQNWCRFHLPGCDLFSPEGGSWAPSTQRVGVELNWIQEHGQCFGLSMLSRLQRSRKMLPLGQGKGLHPLLNSMLKAVVYLCFGTQNYRNYRIRICLHDVKFPSSLSALYGRVLMDAVFWLM